MTVSRPFHRRNYVFPAVNKQGCHSRQRFWPSKCEFLSPISQFSRSVVSESLRAHALQHTRLPCLYHQLPELAQTHVHRVGDAIQSSHPLSSPSPPAFNLCQHQGLFKLSQFFPSGGQNIGVLASASVLPMNIQD